MCSPGWTGRAPGSRQRSETVVRLAGSRGGAGDGEPAGRRGPRVLRVPGDGRDRADEPGPGATAGSGTAPRRRAACSGIWARAGARGGGRLVREHAGCPNHWTWPTSQAFLSGLRTHRDRAMVLAMLLGGLRSAEVRGLRLADVDQGRRRLRVIGKGGRERVVPVDAAFFAELAAYLRHERPARAGDAGVLRGAARPDRRAPVTEAGLRSLFRRHRDTSGAVRVRPHRLRHTYGTELAAAGIDLLALRELMGHASPETTAGTCTCRSSTWPPSTPPPGPRLTPGAGDDRGRRPDRDRPPTTRWLTAYVDHCQRLGLQRPGPAGPAPHRPSVPGRAPRPAGVDEPADRRAADRAHAHPGLAAAGLPDRHRAAAARPGARGVKNLTGLGGIVGAQHADGLRRRPRRGPGWAGPRLGRHRAAASACAVLLAWHGGHDRGPRPQVVDDFDAAARPDDAALAVLAAGLPRPAGQPAAAAVRGPASSTSRHGAAPGRRT